MLFNLFFPRVCVCCSKTLIEQEHFICISCQLDLPKTNALTELTQRKFWGKVNVKKTYSFLMFVKRGKVQKIINALKYKKQPKLGVFLGEMYGRFLLNEEDLKEADLLIPIPLHAKRFKERGYNQAEEFANGLSSILGFKVLNALERTKYTVSQTTFSTRIERFTNIKGLFRVSQQHIDELKGKSVILVDDVLTSGSTLEIAVTALLNAGCKEVSIITIASAV